jgi:hypothetical protein
MRQAGLEDKRKLYDKPWLRTIDKTRNERDLGYGRLLDYKHGAKVEVFWNLGEDAKKDGMFILKIDGKEIMLQTDNVMKFLRWTA